MKSPLQTPDPSLNPWMRYLGGWWPRTFKTADDATLWLAWAGIGVGLASIAATPLVVSPILSMGSSLTVATVYAAGAYWSLVAVSILASSAGSNARARIERSPLLLEALLSPHPISAMADALHWRLRAIGLVSAVMAILLFLPLGVIWTVGAPELATRLIGSQLRPFLQMVTPSELPLGLSIWGLLCTLGGLLAVGASFGAGACLRAMVLATIPQAAPFAATRGMLLTFGVLLLLFLSLAVRLMLFGWIRTATEPSGWYHPGLVALLMEGPLAFVRYLAASRIWRQIERRFAEDITEFVIERSA